MSIGLPNFMKSRQNPIMTSRAPVSEPEGFNKKGRNLLPQTINQIEWLIIKRDGRIKISKIRPSKPTKMP